MAETTHVEGLADLEKKLVALGDVVGVKVLRGALMDAATPIVKAAKEKVPVIEGILQKSIRKRGFVRKTGASVVDVYVGPMKPKGWRGHFIEFGTSRSRAKPFLRPAFDQEWRNSVKIFSIKLAKRIDKAAKK